MLHSCSVPTQQRQSLLARLAVTAQPTRPTQKAPVRTPMPCVLQQRVARVAVKLATLEPMEPGVVSALIMCDYDCMCPAVEFGVDVESRLQA